MNQTQNLSQFYDMKKVFDDINFPDEYYLMEQMEKGDIGLIRDLLKSNIYCHGKRFGARNLVENAIGQPITVQPLLAHLTSKFSEIYNF